MIPHWNREGQFYWWSKFK